ncbi:MAG TPA: PaaI family thioesterase [Ktedonobacterales bacterium]
MPDDLYSLGKTVLAAQPFSVFMGAELITFVPGEVEMVLPLRLEFTQHHGVVHGGVISYLADSAITFAGGSVLGPDVLTAEYKINYVKPGQGDRLIARGSVIAAGGRQAVCRCDVFAVRDGREYLCATAQGTIVKRAEQG